MSKQIAKNTFTGGLLMDLHPLSSQNTVLTNALNASLVTIDGDEMILLNDMGNLKAVVNENDENPIYVTLSKGFIPLGVNTLNGIAYIVSYNPNTLEGEIGTFPSPNYNLIENENYNENNRSAGKFLLENDNNFKGDEDKSKLINLYLPLYNLYKGWIRGYAEEPYFDEVRNSIVSLTTKHFNFDLEHPVDVELQPSYDGSVNIILNDGKNIPRLINSRFAAKEDGTWKIPDRSKNNNNIYKATNSYSNLNYREPQCDCSKEFTDRIDNSECGCIDITCEDELKNQKTFDISTSLSKRIDKFPITVYNGVINNGNLPVGNYVLYYKYCDEDGNETDFIGESGIISVFKGNDNDPFSIDGGERDMDSNKSINVTLKDIDKNYSFVKVYYSRTSAAADENRTIQAFEILKPYEISSGDAHIIITGDEEKQQIPITDLNQTYAIINSADTLVQINNRLFLGNIESLKIHYKELTELSLRVVPYVRKLSSKKKIGYVNPNDYSKGSIQSEPSKIFDGEYYNTKNIYYNVGYWNEEYYRLGIVYIYDDGSLSPVFNILGYEFKDPILFEKTTEETTPLYRERIENIIANLVKINENSKIEINDDYKITSGITPNLTDHVAIKTLNSKGVLKISDNKESDNYWELYNLGVYLSSDLISILKNKYCIKGFFIVRQKRIPTILAQGFTLPWDKESKVPIIEYWGRSIPYTNSDAQTLNSINKYNDTSKSGWSDYYSYLTHNSPFACKYDDSFIWHQKYFVESFLRQAGDSILSEDSETEASHSREVTHDYIPRLYNILPCCIDNKILDLKNLESSTNRLNVSVTFLGKFVQSVYDYYLEQKNEGRYTDDLYNYIIEYLNEANNLGYSTFEEVFEVASNKTNGTDYDIKNIYANNEFVFTLDDNVDYSSEDYEIIERYTNGQLTFNTLSELLDSMDVNPGDTVRITGIFGVKNTLTGIEETKEIVLINQEISSDNISKQYDVKSGYAYKSHKEGSVDRNYYYSDALVTNATGYLLLYDDNREQDILDISCYYANFKLSKEKNVDSWNNMQKSLYSLLKHYYDLYKHVDGNQLTAICPEFEVRQPFFNQLFTGSTFTVRYNKYQLGILVRDNEKERLYFPIKLNNEYYNETLSNTYKEDTSKNVTNIGNLKPFEHYDITSELQYKIVGITDNVPIVAIDNTIFKGVVGSAEEAYRFEYINEEHSPRAYYRKKEYTDIGIGKIDWTNKDKKIFTSENKEDYNMCRGIYSPYLGIVALPKSIKLNNSIELNTEKLRQYCRTFTIYDNSYNDEFDQNYKIRYQNDAPYYPISERIRLTIEETDAEIIPELLLLPNGFMYDLFRGDSFICTFTHRLNRNFNDPVAPTNDKIVQHSTWQKNYNPDESANEYGVTSLSKINRGDVNAVKLGSWITIKVRASYNLSIRSLDERYTTEAAMMGRARGFYPLQQASADGGYKIPNSYLINDGFGSTLGEKQYFTLPDAPYYNDYYADRIVYSDINIQDAYKNGYRVYRSANINDYTKQYGKITKLVDWYGHILCIFEHGVAIIPVNERVESGEGIGGPVFINNNKVLSDTPSMISDKFGSQWKDSIIKTPYAVYGIDSSTKKIWKVTGSTTLPTLSVISDFKVENFLKENIPTLDNDIKKQVALRNIKTHYNQTKSDVIFTFYMTNEDRLAKEDNRKKYKYYDEKAWSLCLNEITSDLNSGSSGNFVTFYSWIPLESFNLNNKFYSFDREEVRGYLSFPEFKSIPINLYDKTINYLGHDIYQSGVYKPNLDVDWCGDTLYSIKKYEFKNNCSELKLNLWEHNNPSIRPLPTHWYGKQHPFEFEFMVVDDPSVQKIWEDLKIISNNAEPESFHFSITGDNYEFTNDIPNIYYRLEATKELYHNLGSHTSYNKDYTKVHPNQLIKSTIFPLYYNRLDMFDLIYDNYQKMTNSYRDYQNLSGTEVYRNPRSRKFELVTHIKNTPIDGQWVRLTELNYQEYLDYEKGSESIAEYLEERYNEYYASRYTDFESEQPSCNIGFKTSTCLPKIKKEKKPKSAFLCDEEYWYYVWVPQSRLRGNSHYKEDKWNILIPTMTFMQKNENKWKNGVPPLILNWIPKDIEKSEISNIDLPNTYGIGQISTARWTFRKETKLRDKYCRIKVRYSGEELAIISAILTTFNISYA